jgi:short-chain Z-isoprenyl diphosphate synthase
VAQRASVRQTGVGIGPGISRWRRVNLGYLHWRWGSSALAPIYALYTSWLRKQVRTAPSPHHVAVILDGNRRWASLAGLREPGAGHRQGADKLDELLAWCGGLGVGEVTVWALSGENLSRDGDEVRALLKIVSEKLLVLSERPGIQIRVFGRIDALPSGLAETARCVQMRTGGNRGLCLNVALGYSGRDELVDATRALISSLAARGIPAAEMAAHVDASAITRHLYTAEHSDPDLIIRTSGEMRLSGFLPWQSSHSEFYFTDVYWPAFRELDFLRAVRTFQQRDRRFGR